jgi:hypothetical protein
MDYLSVSFGPVPADVFYDAVIVEVQSGPFAGRGRAWVTIEQIREFGIELGRFPLTEPALLESFTEHPDGTPEVDLAIGVVQSDPRGTLTVSIRLKGDEPRGQELFARFFADYASLEIFSRQILRIATRAGGEAKLIGSQS